MVLLRHITTLICVFLLSSSVQAQGFKGWFGPNYPGSFKDLVQKVQVSVVNISTSKTVKIRSSFDDFFRMHYGMPKSRQQNSLGTGFIIDSDGFILTNNHVVGGADQINVKLADGRSFSARIVGIDSKTDLAIIKIDAPEGLPVAQLGNSDDASVGDWVLAVGNPFGLGHTVTKGIISAKGRVIGAGPYDDFIQTDASINPGNSGGPLFNLQGEVVGINTAIVQSGQGIGFAIPVNLAKTIIPNLIKGKKVERGFLGIGVQDVPEELARTFHLDAGQGALVSNIVQGGPAHRAGIMPGDVITKYGDRSVKSSQDLPLWVSQTKIGTQVDLEVIRRGKLEQFRVTITSLNKSANNGPVEDSGHGDIGLGIQVKEGGDHTLVVSDLDPKSRAYVFGVRPGDWLLELNGKTLQSLKDFESVSKKLKKGEQVTLSLKRGNMQSVISFTL